MLLGRATPEATNRYAAKHGSLKRSCFFRIATGKTVSSIGIGTYLGDLDPATDKSYAEAVISAVRSGINFIDTSLNYRRQRSERAIGQAIMRLCGSPKIADRDEFFVCTKAGYILPEAKPQALQEDDVVGGMHSMAPAFLKDQLERSRENLGVETIDVFYLHNPETQFGFVDQEVFYERIRAAFRFLEEAVASGKIQYYGAATWEGFRKPHALSLTRMESIANEVGGAGHHFRFIQLPFNLAMPEAIVSRHEVMGGEALSPVEAARRLNIHVVSSASLLQGRLAKELPDALIQTLPGLTTDAQRALQIARSGPGITTALVGMSRPEHAQENVRVAEVNPLSAESVQHLFGNVV